MKKWNFKMIQLNTIYIIPQKNSAVTWTAWGSQIRLTRIWSRQKHHKGNTPEKKQSLFRKKKNSWFSWNKVFKHTLHIKGTLKHDCKISASKNTWMDVAFILVYQSPRRDHLISKQCSSLPKMVGCDNICIFKIPLHQ